MTSSDRKSLGDLGEHLATRYLERQGFHIVERNFKAATGEIDIVSEDGDTLVFVEVRTRSTSTHGMPLETVGYRKRLKLREVAFHYLRVRAVRVRNIRFDVIGILIEDFQKPDITHIRNAFYKGE